MLIAIAGLALMAAPTFPSVKASDLDRKEVQLPDDFSGKVNLVLIAFQRKQQKDVDTWLAVLPAVQKAHPGLAYYELPTIGKMNAMVRFFIDNGMRGGISDRAQRARTITLYIDKPPFKAALGIEAEDRIYALLLNKKGEVIWRAEGVYDDGKGKSLRDFLEAQKE